MSVKRILFILGTRPEAIKLVPIILKMKDMDRHFECKICVTAQHRELLDSVLDFFGILPDYDLDLMSVNQTMEHVVALGIEGISSVIDKEEPDMIFVQGDTTTAFVGALAGFYRKVKVAHIEAGLRSHVKYSPYPEEINRRLISQVSDLHFAPTELAAENLLREGFRESIYVVGNSVIDALKLGLQIIKESDATYFDKFGFLDFTSKIIIVTCHRRENFGKPFQNIAIALKELINKYPDLQIVFPLHPNPNIKNDAKKYLGNIDRIYLIPPLDYAGLIWLMEKSYMIISDSGGIQEEAPSAGIPVLVIRTETERKEGIDAGTIRLVGTNTERIVDTASLLIDNPAEYNKMKFKNNPYGDGKTSEKIIDILTQYFSE